MSESIPTIATTENGPEQFPSMDKVLAGFNKILGSGEITKVVKKVEDGQGLFIFDVEARLPNGDIVECMYKRKNILPATPLIKKPEISPAKEVPSRIQTVVFDSDGSGRSGPQYDFIGGEWIEETVVKRKPSQT